MRQPAYFLDEPRRAVVLQAIREACEQQGWILFAAHVRTNHLHAVVGAEVPSARIAQQLKARSSRALNVSGIDAKDRVRWTRHFSVRSLFDRDARTQAIRYVVNQGEPMARYVRGERS